MFVRSTKNINSQFKKTDFQCKLNDNFTYAKGNTEVENFNKCSLVQQNIKRQYFNGYSRNETKQNVMFIYLTLFGILFLKLMFKHIDYKLFLLS